MSDTADSVLLDDPVIDGQVEETDGSDETSVEEQLLDISQYTGYKVPVKVDGEEVLVPIEEVAAGYSRQADYTRKTQELAQQRAELQWANALKGALDNDPQGTLQLLSQHYGIVSSAPTQQQPDDPFDFDRSWQDEPAVDPRYASLEQRLARFEQEQANQALTSEITRLVGKYGEDFDPQEVVSNAVRLGSNDLEAVYKQTAFDRVLTKAQQAAARAAQLEAQRTAKQAAGLVSGGESARGGGSSDGPAIRSITDAWNAAKRELAQ